MRCLFELAALPTSNRFCPLKVSAVVLLLLVLVLSSWRPAVALGPAMTCGDPQEPGLEHLSQCNDPLGIIISVSDASATEGTDATISFEVSLNKPHPVRSVTMDWSISGYTAVAGEDYTDARGTLTFASGETTKTISISLLDDSASEGVETLTLSLTNPSRASFFYHGQTQPSVSARGTILPDEDTDAPSVTLVTESGLTPPVLGVV